LEDQIDVSHQGEATYDKPARPAGGFLEATDAGHIPTPETYTSVGKASVLLENRAFIGIEGRTFIKARGAPPLTGKR
jgi:hypothetical protein